LSAVVARLFRCFSLFNLSAITVPPGVCSGKIQSHTLLLAGLYELVTMDFSCYVTIQNNLKYPLEFVEMGTDAGYWQEAAGPPNSIMPGQEVMVHLKDYIGMFFTAIIKSNLDLAQQLT
jgi:hypothetical protein